VGTIVTALGCGIGKEEFNADKLRYHSIIIMTDADVDGSHIRTLLLTFFFRQMRELIERGHIFIAQPPLYKIAKGKQHHYLKDDEALDRHLTQSALEGSLIFVNPNAPAISGRALEELVHRYRSVAATIERLSRLYSESVLWEMVYGASLMLEQLREEQVVSAYCTQLSERLLAVAPKGSSYAVLVRKDQERQLYYPVVKLRSHGVDSETEYHHEFFSSGEYRSLIALGETLNNLIEADGYFQRGDKVLHTRRFADGLQWFMDEARKGHTIQRYKGLGEMNPEQLWETTMDPDVRRMLKVTIEDAIAADQIFTTLMGDQVEPRREFIEKNALSVANLDI
jgi:DNA gyrase subunit B